MGRPAKSLHQYAAEFDCLEVEPNENFLYCKHCNVEVTPSSNRIKEHIASQLHKKMSAKLPKITPFVKKATKLTKSHLFVESLLKSYVPLEAIDSALGNFMRENFLPTLPTRKWCSSKYIDELFDDKVSTIQKMVDEIASTGALLESLEFLTARCSHVH